MTKERCHSSALFIVGAVVTIICVLLVALCLLGEDSVFFSALQYFTVCFGISAITMSSLLALHFGRSRRPIGKAVGFMLAGEAVGGLATIIFAITSQGVMDIGSATSSIVLRWVIFSTAMVTSLHLAYQTRKIEISDD